MHAWKRPVQHTAQPQHTTDSCHTLLAQLRRHRRPAGSRVLSTAPWSSISFGIGATEGTLYAVNLANVTAFSTGFGPALVAIDVDCLASSATAPSGRQL